MSKPTYDEFFRTATGCPEPYDYQRRLACGEQGAASREDWLSRPHPDGCRSQIINIPTGLGEPTGVK